jgi:hypothetical protein
MLLSMHSKDSLGPSRASGGMGSFDIKWFEVKTCPSHRHYC